MNPLGTFFSGEHEEVVLFQDPVLGLKCVVAIHSTQLGPALGGVRMWNYDTVDMAVEDALRLSKSMTYKAAVAGLNLGGGTAVILANPRADKNEALFRCFGSFVESLHGRYIAAEDVGTDVNDMEYIFMETSNVVGVAQTHGGTGDPTPWTARGLVEGLRACVEAKLGQSQLEGLSVSVQGAGHVGSELIEQFVGHGMKVYVCDIDSSRCDRYRENPAITVVKPEEIYDVPVDIFSPCALGAVLNERTIPRLRCRIVAGGANNQLASDQAGDDLFQRGILYAPDYAINSGGLMSVSMELSGYDDMRASRMMRSIYYVMKDILAHSAREKMAEYRCADRVAEKRISEISRLRGRYLARTETRFKGRERL